LVGLGHLISKTDSMVETSWIYISVKRKEKKKKTASLGSFPSMFEIDYDFAFNRYSLNFFVHNHCILKFSNIACPN